MIESPYQVLMEQCRACLSGQGLRGWAGLILSAPRPLGMFLGLLITDLVFVAVFVFYGVQQVISDNPAKFPQIWSLAADHSIPEFFGYAKLLLAAVLLVMTFRNTTHLIWWAWSVVFGLLAMDDMLQLHERGGDWIAGFLPVGPIAGIELHHYGELIIYALLGAIAGAALILGLLRTPVASAQKSGFFLIVAAGLVTFGIGVDLISSASYFQDTDHSSTVSKILYGALIIIEDGGEAFFMTLGCAGAYAIWLASKARTSD